MNTALRNGLILAASLVVAYFALRAMGALGHEVGSAATRLERKL